MLDESSSMVGQDWKDLMNSVKAFLSNLAGNI